MTDDSAMFRLFEQIEEASNSDCPMLMQGEAGTERELFARAIYLNSSRQDQPFLSINCKSDSESFFEEAEKTAFLEKASGGILFLDEIDEMPLILQKKLFHFLSDPSWADVRIIAATSQDLEKKVFENQFLSELFDFLNRNFFYLPPLRSYPAEMDLMVEYLIEKFNDQTGSHVRGVSPHVLDLFRRYSWPGNLLELENLIEQLVTLKKEGCIALADIPEIYKRETYGEDQTTILKS